MADAKTELEQIQDQLDRLKSARELLERSKLAQKEMLDKFQTTDDWQEISIQRAFAATEVEQLEATIKYEALEMFNASMELPEAVTIKNFTIVEILDEKAAREWCFTNLRKALKFDAKVFEAEAKDKNNDIPAELATVSKEARAQIATKL